MTKLRSFRFPEDKLELLREIAEREHNNNLTKALLEAIDRYYRELNPPVLQGYIRLDRFNELDGKEECQGCDQPLSPGTWIAVYSDGTVKGVLCDDCVEAG